MKNPFIFGHLSEPKGFVNRGDDILRLRQNIENKINTILISPRRWGKSSLVKVLETKSGLPKNYVFCYLDMFNTNNEEDFYNQYSNAILKSASSKFEDMMTNVKHFLSSLKPNFSFESEGSGKLSFDITSETPESSFLDVLNLGEHIAQKKKKHLVVCIDEFQNLSRFLDPLLFQQRLRASWQHHQHVTYILYGSKRSMLSSIFESQSMPFYKFGDVFYLQKIDTKHWLPFIQTSFRKTKKKIAKKFAVQLIDLMESHTYYVQQFAHILWNNTTEEVDVQIFKKSVSDIIGRNSLMFENIYEGLSIYQARVLRMLVEDGGAKYTGSAMIKKHSLVSSANVIQALRALENKEVIDRFEGAPMFVDPVLRMWIIERIIKGNRTY
ncbi:MAG: AAA family ATPase [Bacteroidales bacterium]|nr:AAA family ATPase [Bacteroidales bacterium]